jgi:hypothetical protein
MIMMLWKSTKTSDVLNINSILGKIFLDWSLVIPIFFLLFDLKQAQTELMKDGFLQDFID